MHADIEAVHAGDDVETEADDTIVIYQSSNRDGATFALSLDTEDSLVRRFGAKLEGAPRVFIAHATRDAFHQWRARHTHQILALLTGLDDDDLRALGEPEFRSAVTEELV